MAWGSSLPESSARALAWGELRIDGYDIAAQVLLELVAADEDSGASLVPRESTVANPAANRVRGDTGEIGCLGDGEVVVCRPTLGELVRYELGNDRTEG
jgi:hypothetical protein